MDALAKVTATINVTAKTASRAIVPGRDGLNRRSCESHVLQGHIILVIIRESAVRLSALMGVCMVGSTTSPK